MARAFGKVILLGEHAVVHGHPALAGAIDRGVRLTASAGPLRLRIAAWGIDVAAGDDHVVARALGAVAEALGVTTGTLDGDADLPAAAGLGSSAATSVAVARALAGLHGIAADAARLAEAATAGERCFHGNPSGVDVALAIGGGLGVYRRGQGLQPLDAAPVPIVIGLSGEPRSTAAMVARVADALAAAPTRAGEQLGSLGAAATEGAAIVCAAAPDLPRLGALMTSAHRTLTTLGVGSAGLDALVDAALGAGALGAKLTGAGGGGAVIALAPGRQDAVLDAWRAAGRDAFACQVGARP
jgi:mevalonate kinase